MYVVGTRTARLQFTPPRCGASIVPSIGCRAVFYSKRTILRMPVSKVICVSLRMASRAYRARKRFADYVHRQRGQSNSM